MSLSVGGGNSGAGGALIAQAGSTTGGGTSGAVLIGSVDNTDDGATGQVVVTTGNAGTVSGVLHLATGSSRNEEAQRGSGDVLIESGSSSSAAGEVRLSYSFVIEPNKPQVENATRDEQELKGDDGQKDVQATKKGTKGQSHRQSNARVGRVGSRAATRARRAPWRRRARSQPPH